MTAAKPSSESPCGTQDLKITSTAIVHDVVLLSANLQDLEQVPGLHVEDWLYDR